MKNFTDTTLPGPPDILHTIIETINTKDTEETHLENQADNPTKPSNGIINASVEPTIPTGNPPKTTTTTAIEIGKDKPGVGKMEDINLEYEDDEDDEEYNIEGDFDYDIAETTCTNCFKLMKESLQKDDENTINEYIFYMINMHIMGSLKDETIPNFIYDTGKGYLDVILEKVNIPNQSFDEQFEKNKKINLFNSLLNNEDMEYYINKSNEEKKKENNTETPIDYYMLNMILEDGGYLKAYIQKLKDKKKPPPPENETSNGGKRRTYKPKKTNKINKPNKTHKTHKPKKILSKRKNPNRVYIKINTRKNITRHSRSRKS